MRTPANRTLVAMLAAFAAATPAAIVYEFSAGPDSAMKGQERDLGVWKSGGPPKPAYREGQRRRKRKRK